MIKETFFIPEDLKSYYGILTPVDALQFSKGEVVRNTPSRKTLRIGPSDSGALFLKQYLAGRIWPGFHRQRSEVEKKALQVLPGLGLSVPKLLGWGSRFGVGSFLLWKGCEGEPLDRALAQGYPNPLGLTDYRVKKLWIESLAALIARLHAAGFVHRDLYLGHLLYEGFQEGKPVLHLIDLQRVTKKRLRRWYVKDLAAMYFSAPHSISRADRLRFLKLWLVASGKSESTESVGAAHTPPLQRHVGWVRAILKKAQRIAKHRPKYG